MSDGNEPSLCPSFEPLPEGQLRSPYSGPVQIPLATPKIGERDGSLERDAIYTVSPSSSRLWGRGYLSSLPSRLRREPGSIDAKQRDVLRLGETVDADVGQRGRDPGSMDRLKDEPLTRSATSPFAHSSTLPLSASDQASNLILGAIGRERTSPIQAQPPPPSTSRSTGLSFFGMKSSASGSTSPLTPPMSPQTPAAPPKVVVQSSIPVGAIDSHERRYRPPSPFFRARRSREKARARDTSPDVRALPKEDATESDGESVGVPRKFQPQASAYEDGDDSGTEADVIDLEDDVEVEDDAGVDDTMFDEETEKNTEANRVFYEGAASGLGGRSADAATEQPEDNRDVLDTFGEEVEQDVLGEGPNVVVPPPALFPAAQMNQARSRKSLKSGLDLVTSRPAYARDRCTITLTHGNPDEALEVSGKRMRRYVVLSDLSEESRYAVEWAIGTVARDGDEIFLISVKEDESKGVCVVGHC